MRFDSHHGHYAHPQFTFAVVTLTKPSGEDRCVALCSTIERARQIVERNEGDIWETIYRYVVIERRTLDVLYGDITGESVQEWYEWHGPKGWAGVGKPGYVKLDSAPNIWKHAFGFVAG